MTDSAPAIQVAFPAVNTSDPAFVTKAVVPVPSALDRGMQAAVATQQSRQALSCLALLQGGTRDRAVAEARQLYPQMRGDATILMSYGADAVAPLNALSAQLLHRVPPVRIDELTALMHKLNEGMRDVKHRYDMSDPKVRDHYASWKGGVSRLWGRARTLLDLFLEDITSIESQLDKVSKTLQGKQFEMMQFVGFYDELYDTNEEELLKLIYVIGVMEEIVRLATDEAAAIQVGDSALGDRGGEHKAKLAQFAENLSIKIAEYKGRLALGWATSPSVRTMQALDVSLAIKINELVNLTIPSMKQTIVTWRMLMESMDAAKFGELVAAASNQWTQAAAAAYATAVPIIAQTVETPTLTPETVAAMANAISTAADGVIAAVHDGQQRRQALDAAIMSGNEVMKASSGRVSDAIIQQVLAAATAPIEVTTHVPAAITSGSSDQN